MTTQTDHHDDKTDFGVSSFPEELDRRIVAERTYGMTGGRSQYLEDAARVFETVLEAVEDDRAEVSTDEILADVSDERINEYTG